MAGGWSWSQLSKSNEWNNVELRLHSWQVSWLQCLPHILWYCQISHGISYSTSFSLPIAAVILPAVSQHTSTRVPPFHAASNLISVLPVGTEACSVLYKGLAPALPAYAFRCIHVEGRKVSDQSHSPKPELFHTDPDWTLSLKLYFLSLIRDLKHDAPWTLFFWRFPFLTVSMWYKSHIFYASCYF